LSWRDKKFSVYMPLIGTMFREKLQPAPNAALKDRRYNFLKKNFKKM